MKLSTAFFFSILLLTKVNSHGQTTEITVNILQAFSPQARLNQFVDDKYIAIDSSHQLAPGTYRFSREIGYKPGLYRVDVGRNINIYLVLNMEPKVDVATVVYAPDDSLKSKYSLENQIYWKFQSQKKRHKQQVWLTQALMDYYPDTSTFYQQLEKELDIQNLKFNMFTIDLVEKHPNLLASSYIKLEQPPIASEFDDVDEQHQHLIDIWWNEIDLTNTLILNSPSLKSRIWGYIELFFNDSLDKEEQDLAFIKAVHLLMERDMNLEVKLAMRNILIDGFVNTDYQDVMEYLQYNKIGGLHPLKEKPKNIKSKKTSTLKVGERTYDFKFTSSEGEVFNLSKLDAEYKLLLFWSSWCPHCIETMPKIKDIYNGYKDSGFEIIAVSLDDEQSIWQRYINDLGLEWINTRIPFSADKTIYSMYDVNETPKMFLLSRDLTIISRPSTIRQLEVRLRKIMR